MESLKQAIYGIFSPPTNQPCSGTRPVCLTVGVIHQLSVKSGGTERNCFPNTGGFPRQALWEVGQGR